MNEVESKELGRFLRSRREAVLPEQVGLPPGVRRRVSGLRREEVAALSGISTTWYTFIEQGRPSHVAQDVLVSIGRALALNDGQLDYLFRLAGEAKPAKPSTSVFSVEPGLQRIVDSLGTSPALVLDRRWNIAAWNLAAAVVFADFSSIPREERNCIWLAFTDAAYRSRFANWEPYAQGLVAQFRHSLGDAQGCDWAIDFVNRLSSRSSQFSSWWKAGEVEAEGNHTLRRIINSPAGRLVFDHTTFLVADNVSLRMLVDTPAPGTDTEERIRQLC